MGNIAIPASIIIAGTLIAIAILIAGRWEIFGSASGVWRLDRWTGAVQLCHYDTPNAKCQ
jgi:hypothetical protein